MKVKYGGYTLTDCAAVQISRTPRRDSTGKRIGATERWTVQGWLVGTDAADLTTKINALKAAFALEGQNLGLYTNADVATSHVITNSQTLGGVRVVEEASFPEGAGPEYANVRHFQVSLEADFQDAGLSNLVSFQETVAITGTGGSRFVTLVPLDGLPVQQTVSRFSPVTVVQSGTSVGLTAYPLPAPPLLGTGERLDRRQIARRSPDRLADGTHRNYQVDWQYEFELIMAVPVSPHQWGT